MQREALFEYLKTKNIIHGEISYVLLAHRFHILHVLYAVYKCMVKF